MEHGYLYELLRKLGLSDFQAGTFEFLLVRPLKIVLIVVVATIANRVGSRAIRRFVRSLHTRAPLLATSIRAEQRASTVGDALAGLLRIVIWAVTALLVLDQLGVSLAPLLAGAGIAGVAIGFGAQSLVKDFLSGLFILMEDQYGVGDLVEVGTNAKGTVEDVNLRVTRVRSVDGTVWFVPNGEIRTVGNSSMEWSRAVVDILVPHGVDVGAVTRAFEEVASSLVGEEQWRGDVLEPPEVWGVQGIDVDGVTVRVVIKTAPRRQSAVARELRGRLIARLLADGVRTAVPPASA